tara:strand:- start:930 stop:1442 length:513 start_codon:yes stop_codon:yes gene_type:complete
MEAGSLIMDKITLGSNSYMSKLRRSGLEFTLNVDEETYKGTYSKKSNGAIQVSMNNQSSIGFSEKSGNEIYVYLNGVNYVLKSESGMLKDNAFEEESGDTVLSPITGKLLDKKVKSGDSVSKDEVVVILEAMKMEHRLKAPRDGKLSKLTSAEIGDQIKEGELMFELEKE